MTLTPKQERFAQEVASGKSQADAYRAAFNVRPTTKPETTISHASRLMADGNVSARVKELRAAATEKLVWTIHDSLEVLSAIAKGLDEDAKPSDKVNAVKALNSMYGLDEPTKVNLNGSMVHKVVRQVIDGTDADD